MSRNKKLLTFIGLIILLLLTFLLFFGMGDTEKNGIQISSFIFILVNELILFGNIFLLTNKKLNTFSVAGISSLTFIYIVCSLLFNILFISLFKTVRAILVFNFSILLIYIFIYVMILWFKKEN